MPWKSPYNSRYTLYLVMEGLHSAEEMLEIAEGENQAVTWLLRAVSFAVCFVGVRLVLSPVEALAAVIPCVGACLAEVAAVAATLLRYARVARVSLA